MRSRVLDIWKSNARAIPCRALDRNKRCPKGKTREKEELITREVPGYPHVPIDDGQPSVLEEVGRTTLERQEIAIVVAWSLRISRLLHPFLLLKLMARYSDWKMDMSSVLTSHAVPRCQ